MQRLIVEHLDEIAALCRTHHVKRLELFGSAAREDFNPEKSDVDFLVEFEPEHSSWGQQFALKQALEAVLGRKVDLIAGTVRNPYIRRTIEQDRTPVYAA